MLRTPAPFPEVGSFALFVDTGLPAAQQRAELVRILRHDNINDRHFCAVAFPLRLGATGNRNVPIGELIDATPLTVPEQRELTDLQRDLRGRKRRNAIKAARSHALAQRLTWSVLLLTEQRKLDSLAARTDRRAGASAGSLIGSVAA